MSIIINNGISALAQNVLIGDIGEAERVARRKSYLGTPVWNTLEIPAQRVQTLDGVRPFEGIRIDTVLMQVTESKNIITTALQGVDGTVKEYISKGDYQIQMSGILVGESSESNKKFTVGKGSEDSIDSELYKLIQICDAPATIEVISDFLQLFEIKNIVIQSVTYQQQEGRKKQIAFDISALSDNPIELVNL